MQPSHRRASLSKREEQSLFPHVYSNLRRALVPFMHHGTYAALHAAEGEVAARAAAPAARRAPAH